jgi:hypothetical protein
MAGQPPSNRTLKESLTAIRRVNIETRTHEANSIADIKEMANDNAWWEVHLAETRSQQIESVRKFHLLTTNFTCPFWSENGMSLTIDVYPFRPPLPPPPPPLRPEAPSGFVVQPDGHYYAVITTSRSYRKLVSADMVLVVAKCQTFRVSRDHGWSYLRAYKYGRTSSRNVNLKIS